MTRQLLTGCAVLLALVGVPTSASSQPYRVVDLGVLPGQVSSAPSDINNAQQIVGLSGDQAFVWDPVNGLRALGWTMNSPPQTNNSGIVAGVRSAGSETALVALVNGVEYVLATPPDTITAVKELTDNNWLLLQGSRSWALADGQFFDLTAAFGGGALALNEQGMVGGGNAAGPYLRFPGGQVVQPWPGLEPVRLIGASGHFAGAGFYGTPDGTVVPTPLVVQPLTSVPLFYGINRQGDVVGARARFFEFAPFLYRAGRVLELSTLTHDCDCQLMSARAINDRGDIAGIARFAGGAQRGVLLVPIPPATPSGFQFAVRATTVTLAWDASPGALDYILEAGSQPGASDLFNGSVGDVTSLSVTVPPGRYYVRLRARNAAGTSAPTIDLIIDVP